MKFLRLGTVGLVAVALLAACASKPLLVGGGLEINDVETEGVERFSKSELLSHLYSGETSWLPFSPDQPFDRALLAIDAGRIVALYRSYGYRQARIRDVRFVVDEDDEDVDLFLSVDEGPCTTIRSLAFEWRDGALEDEELRREVEAAAGLAVDQPLEEAAINDAVGSLRLAMQQQGHPLARARAEAVVDDALHVGDVTVVLLPGPSARVGDVRFEGLVHVPEYLVAREVRFAQGEPWTPARVRQMEDALRSMRVFRWVAAEPHIDVRDGAADVTLRVSEADPHTVRVGVQLALEAARWQEQLRVDYTNTNLFGHLTRLDLSTVVGWAELPNPWAPFQHGPVLTVEPALTKKGLLEDHLLWSLVPGFDLDIQEGYQYYQPRNRLSVARWFVGVLKLTLAHDVRMVDFFNVSSQLEENDSILGRDFRDPFVLSALEFEAEAYFTDSITEPTQGVILDASYAISGFFLGSHYDFHQVEAGLRAYYKPVDRLQFALQIRSGTIIPWGADGASPFSHRYYLGGANDVRGWGTRRLSPRLEECDGEEDDDCSSVPIGGQTMLHANLELRVHLFWKVSGVVFADMGDVQSGALSWKADEWNYTTGAGVRVDTPLGLVRLDFGWRLNDPGVYPDEPRWGLHFGFGEAF